MTGACAAAPTILVLMATYNGAPWLAEQIDSILSQQGVQVRLLIGDDASTDATRHLLETGWGDDARVRILTRDQGSGSAGANFRQLYVQADLAGVDFVALADQDDIWMPRKLLDATKALAAGGAGGYSCAVQAFWPDGRQKTLQQHPGIRRADFLFEGAGQGCTFVVTATLFAKVQAFCRQQAVAVAQLHYHDWLIYLLDRAWGGAWHFDPIPGMRYRQHAGNEIGARGGTGAIARRLSMIRNGWYGKQVGAAVAIYQLAGGRDPVVLRMAQLTQRRPSLGRKLGLTVAVLRHGRRSLADRGVLALAACLNWL